LERRVDQVAGDQHAAAVVQLHDHHTVGNLILDGGMNGMMRDRVAEYRAATARLDPLELAALTLPADRRRRVGGGSATHAALHDETMLGARFPERRGQRVGFGKWQSLRRAFHQALRRISALDGGADGPDTTRQWRAFSTWQVDVPRICLTPSSTSESP